MSESEHQPSQAEIAPEVEPIVPPIDRIRRVRTTLEQFAKFGEEISRAAELEALTRYVEEHPNTSEANEVMSVLTDLDANLKRWQNLAVGTFTYEQEKQAQYLREHLREWLEKGGQQRIDELLGKLTEKGFIPK